jgi:hypothetical protein
MQAPEYNEGILPCFDLMSSKLKRCDEIVKEYDVSQLIEKYLQIEHEYQTVMN